MKTVLVVLLLMLVAAGVLGVIGFRMLRSSGESAGNYPPVRHAPAATVSPEVIRSALAPYQAALDASRRPVVHISLEDFPADELLASKVGGRAWWPEKEAPPVGEQGAPLVLLAQINFAEMPASQAYPGEGLLQFFIGTDDLYGANFDGEITAESLSRQRNFRVAYWPETGGPAKALSTPAEDVYTPHRANRPHRMRFTPGEEPLSSSDYRFHDLLGGQASVTLETWAAANGHGEEVVYAVFEQLHGAGHKFGGYPYFTQEDPRNGGPLELLFQLDSDDGADLMWGDSGVGGFFIDPADLAKGDFSRVLYNWDCH